MKKLISIMALILALPFIMADLTIQPNPYQVDVQVNQAKSFFFNITNTYPFQVTDFVFSNLSGFSFPAISLGINETKKLNFTVNLQNSIQQSINSKVTFNYLVDIPQEITTYHINITATGFQPNYIVIRAGDTIIWHNLDDISHTVTSSTFDYSLDVNQTAQNTFNSVSHVDYNDLNLFFTGSVKIINRTEPQKVHNPNYDTTWTINLNSILNPTGLEISTLQDNFQVDATGTTEDVLKIINIGNEIAQNIHVSSDLGWVGFDSNDFSISPTSTKIVKYTIAPIIYSSNQTNQTYTILLKIKASNSIEYIKNISVFIPYSKSFENSSSSNQAFMVWFKNVFCPQNPQLFICNTSVSMDTAQQIIIRDPIIPVNLTVTQFYDIFKRMQRIEDSNARTDNKIKEVSDKLDIQVPQMMDMLNQSMNKQQINERNINDRWDAVWIIGIFLVIAGCIVAIFLAVRKYYFSKNVMEVYDTKKN